LNNFLGSSGLDAVRRITLQFGGKVLRWLREPTNFSTIARRLGSGQAPVFVPALKITEMSLWIVAVASLGYCLLVYATAAVHQHREKALLNAARVGTGLTLGGGSAGAVPSLVATTAQSAAEPDYGVLGTIEIPRLGISSVVEEGVDSSTLWEAVGHIPGTALPGQNGNSALASHRDTYFRGLGEVQTGDLIVFRSPTANFRYRVESTQIVDANATDALPDSATPTLSLITCYPFHYIGPAPQRFIVTARAESSSE
jgi:sortase A